MTEEPSKQQREQEVRLLCSEPGILLTGLTGLVLSVCFFLVSLAAVERIVLRDFSKKAETACVELHQTVEQMLLDMGSLKKFFECSQEVTREEFRDFAVPILNNSPILLSLSWIPSVSSDAEETDLGVCSVCFGEPAVPPAQQQDFFVVPDPLLLERCRSTGKAAVAYPNLKTPRPGPFRILLCVPVFPKNSKDERQISGYLAGLFEMGRFLSSRRAADEELTYALQDCSCTAEPIWIYGQKRPLRPAGWLDSFRINAGNFCHTETLACGDRLWRVYCQPKANYKAGFSLQIPWIILSAGLFLSSLLTLYLRDLQRRNLRTSRLISQRTAELEVQKQKAEHLAWQAEQASRAKSSFLANMSHEIRTPMNAILGFAELLCETPLETSQRHFLQLIVDSGRSLLALINDILDFSKIESGKLTVEKIPCALADLLVGMRAMMEPAALNKHLDFQILPEGRLPAEILADPLRLRQCLINLIGNAVKFTNQGHIYLRVSVQTDGPEPLVCFAVEDTGIGIPPDRLDRIFEPFVQSEESTTRQYGGTGLGLTITRRLCELMGGDLSVQSRPGEGSVFTLRIPAGVNLNTAGAFDQTLFQKGALNLKPAESEQIRFWGHVLVAEDAPASQILIRKLLEKYGLEVTIAADGRQAVQQVLSRSYDLILMDMHMPEMNGYDATRLLREQGCVIPIIALTASAMKSDEAKCLQAGCDAYLTKPIQRTELVKMLKQYLLFEQISAEAEPSMQAGIAQEEPSA